MKNVTVEKIMGEVKKLTPEDQQKLRDQIDMLLKPAVPITEEEFQEKMERIGLITRPARLPEPIKHGEQDLIEVTGKPVSEIILEERR